MKKSLLFFILILTSFSFVFGQNSSLYTSNKEYTVFIKYSNFNNRQVLDRIANANHLFAQNMKYSYKLTFHKKIVKNSVRQLKINVRLSKIFFPTINYRNFELSESYLPRKVSYSIVVYKNNKQIASFNSKNDLKEGEIAINYLNDSTIQNNQIYSVELKNINIAYNNNGVNNFNSWASLVDNYYKASKKSDEFYNQIHGIPTNPNALSITPDLQKVYDYNDVSLQAVNFVKRTRQSLFYKTLVLKKNDPKKLENNLNILFQESSTLHASCTNVINQMDIIYFDRGNKEYRYRHYQKALFNFNKSVDVNPNYTPSHYMIAEIDYNMGNFKDCENILKNILLNIRGDANTLNKTAVLANNLYNNYLTFSEKEISSKNFDKALDWLFHAQDLCNSLAEVNCDEHLTNDFIVVYEGKMDYMLQKVDNSMKNFQMKDAENSLKQAIDFRKAHIQFLKDDKPLIDRSVNIYKKYISLGDEAKKNKNFDVAINDYNLARNFCSENEFVQCPGDIDGLITNVKYNQYNDFISKAQTKYNYAKVDEAEKLLIQAEDFRMKNNLEISAKYNLLYNRIKQKQYYNFIKSGLSKKKNANYQEALTDFSNAKKIEEDYKIKKNYNLKYYVKDASKKLVLQKINTAEQDVKQNNIEKARTITHEAREIANQYNIMSDKQINAAFTSINSKIFSQECMNYKKEFNDYFIQAKEKINDKKYLSANNLLKKAKNVSSSHDKCYINTANVDDKINEIKDAVDYLQIMELAKSNYNRRDYSSAINSVNKAIKQFDTKEIALKYELQEITLNEFISKRSNEFVLYGAGYFLSNNSLENALSMLNILKNRNEKSKYTKYVQTNLGTKLAVRDHEKISSSNPKSNVLKYTFNDKWFKYLRKSYIKTWKKL